VGRKVCASNVGYSYTSPISQIYQVQKVDFLPDMGWRTVVWRSHPLNIALLMSHEGSEKPSGVFTSVPTAYTLAFWDLTANPFPTTDSSYRVLVAVLHFGQYSCGKEETLGCSEALDNTEKFVDTWH
jgi:hypothetical protein